MRLFIFALLCACGLSAQEVVTGHVVNSVTGEPIVGADVKFTCLGEDDFRRVFFCKDSQTKTAGDGGFVIKANFSRRLKFRLAAGGSPGLVAARGSEMEAVVDYRRSLRDVTLKLSPEGRIAGKVLDENGVAKPDVIVGALRLSAHDLKLVSKAKTDQNGEYVIPGLASGDYYVATAIPHEDKNDPTTPYLLFAPQTLSLDEATLTHLNVAQQVSGIELHMRPVLFRHLQGKAQMETVNSIPGDLPQLHLDYRDRAGYTLPAREIVLNADGKFEIDVLPGTYSLRMTGAQAAPQPKASVRPPATVVHLLAKQDLDVEGKDLLSLLVLIPPPITLTGHVTLDPPSETVAMSQGKVTIRPTDPGATGGALEAAVQPDGTFVFTNCDPARYALRVIPPKGTYVKSVTLNQQDATNQLLDLSRGVGGEMTVVLHQGAPSVSGSVAYAAADTADASSAAPTLFDVVLIPDSFDPKGGGIGIYHAATKQGKFNLSNLPPGHWTAIATTGVEPGAWDNLAFVQEMQARGVGFDLAEGDRKELSPVPLVPFEEIDKMLDRLGVY